MRIITGSKRGKKLSALEGEQVRPTTDRVKESLFTILQFQLEGRRFLDLFAGSGQIGLEALSRGAAQAVFVDLSRDSIRVVERNIKACGFQDSARVVRSGLLEQALPLAAGAMNPGGILVCEHPRDEALPEEAGPFRKYREYRYGKIMLTTYLAQGAQG